MAASRSTADYDIISIRTVRTAPPQPAFTALTSDGQGGTYWSTISSPMAFVSAFKTISFSPVTRYVADASFNTLAYKAGAGIQFAQAGLNQSQIDADVFAEIKVPGQTSISSGLNAIVFSTFFFSSLGNTLFTNPSTNILTYEIRHPFFKASNTILPLNDAFSTFSLIGSNAIILSTNTKQPGNYTIGIGISSFTSSGFGHLVENTSTISGKLRSTFASSLVTFAKYSTGIVGISTSTGASISSFYQSTVFIDKNIHTAISTFSTSASKFYTDISGCVSTFSTLLSFQMQANTIVSTNSIFGQPWFILPNKTTVNNLVYTLQDMSNYMSSQIMSSYTLRITTSNLASTSLCIGSTIQGTSSYIITNEGRQMSTFSTLMTSTFTNFLISTPSYINIWSTPSYTVYSSIQTAKGSNYDSLISTCEMSLSSFVQYLTPSSRVFIEYSPCYIFNTLLTPNTSTNMYQVSTFISHDGYTVPSAAFTDFMNPTQIYNRGSRFEISTGYLLAHHTLPFIFKHSHSSIMYVDSTKSRINTFNPLGGVVLPSRYITDCGLNLTTTTTWTNYMSPTNAIAVGIFNASV